MKPTLGMFIFAGVMYGVVLMALISALLFGTPPPKTDLVSISGAPTNVDLSKFKRARKTTEEVSFELDGRSFRYRSKDKKLSHVKRALMGYETITLDIHPRKKYTMLSGTTEFWGFRSGKKVVLSYRDMVDRHAEGLSACRGLLVLFAIAVAIAATRYITYQIWRKRKESAELSSSPADKPAPDH